MMRPCFSVSTLFCKYIITELMKQEGLALKKGYVAHKVKTTK